MGTIRQIGSVKHTVEEAQTLLAYHTRELETRTSPDRRARAARAIAKLRAELALLATVRRTS